MESGYDKWSEELRRKLEGYEEPVSGNVWDAISRDLEKQKTRRRMRLMVVRVVAAAACVALIAGIYVFLKDGASTLGTLQSGVSIPEITAETNEGEEEVNHQEASRPSGRLPGKLIAVARYADSGKRLVVTADTVANDAVSPESRSGDAGDDGGNAVDAGGNKKDVEEKFDEGGKKAYPLFTGVSAGVSKKNRRFGVSVKVDNGIIAQNSSNGGFMPIDRQARPFGPLYASSQGEAAFNSSYAEMVANNVERPVRTDLQYDVPVTAAVSFRYEITDRWSVDAGLSFTRTGASWRSGSDEHYYRSKQKAYFVGIPVDVSFTIFDSRYFSFYALAGGSVEKCVAGNVSTSLVGGLEDAASNMKEGLAEHPWMFSVAAGVGAQFNITDRSGIFAEPRIAYVFDTAEDMLLRKNNSPQFNLSVGVRFSY